MCDMARGSKQLRVKKIHKIVLAISLNMNVFSCNELTETDNDSMTEVTLILSISATSLIAHHIMKKNN